MQNTLFDIFSISKQTKNFYTRNTRSMHKWEEFHDPNDKFCVHHIEEIIRNFLPCRDNSGIAQLIKS